jgi:hypothetical protein
LYHSPVELRIKLASAFANRAAVRLIIYLRQASSRIDDLSELAKPVVAKLEPASIEQSQLSHRSELQYWRPGPISCFLFLVLDRTHLLASLAALFPTVQLPAKIKLTALLEFFIACFQLF